MTLLAVAGAGACAEDGEPGIRLELLAPADPAKRPEWIYYYWLSPTGVLLEGRMPDEGTLPASGETLTSLFIGTNGPLGEARALVVRGQRGDVVVSGLANRLDPTDEARRSLRLQLGERLADSDGDGTPDVVERNCLMVGADMTCAAPPDAGTPEPPRDGGPPADGPVLDGDPPTDGPGVDPPVDAPLPGDGPDGPSPPDVIEAPRDQPVREVGNPNPALSIGLIAHWRFDDGSGTSLRDSSGNGNTGTLLGTGTRFVPEGKIGGALDVPAADGNGVTVLPTGSVETVSNAFTIAAWTYRTANRSGLSNVLSRRSAEVMTAEYFALAFNNNGQVRGFINTHLSPSPPSVSSAANVPLNQWVHVAVTYDRTTIRAYINGMPSGSTNYNQPVVSGSMPLCIGCGNNRAGNTNTDETLGGRVDELVLYSRALPLAEIQQLASGDLPVNP